MPLTKNLATRLSSAAIIFLLVTAPSGGLAQPATNSPDGAATALLKVYPGFLDRIEGNELVWKDGTRMLVDDGKGAKTFGAMLDEPDIKEMFSMQYPLGDKGVAPAINFDPGRVRYAPLFKKMYGNCTALGFMRSAAEMRSAAKVGWLPKNDGKKLKFSKINGAAAALQEVSNELDRLPPRFLAYLRPSQGTYNCRTIAGTKRRSAHGYGIAIDLAEAHSDYWRWSEPDAHGPIPYKNETPLEIVWIFERHGFIWGGKWYHYDTMHFEYRPEMIAAGRT